MLHILALLRLVSSQTIGSEQVLTQLKTIIPRMCDATRSKPIELQACADSKRFQSALQESGHRLSPAESDPWDVLEGEALRRHPDPLGALQRGEVPAVMLRGFLPEDELRMMRTRMAQLTVRIFACRYSANINGSVFANGRSARAVRKISNESVCVDLNKRSADADLAWPHWCTLLAHVEHDCEHRPELAEVSECVALRSRHPVFDRCRHDIGRRPRRTTFTRLRQDKVVRQAAREFGSKLYGNLGGPKQKFMRSAGAIDALHDVMARGCTGRYCSPKHAMLAGVAELAGPSRTTQQAEERPGEKHSPGTIRAMSNGWLTPLHMDSKHSNAFAALRQEMCGDPVMLSLHTSPTESARFQALTRHRFAASAILTLHAPDRSSNPFDLNVFRHRWPALLENCSVKYVDAYGIGVRFQRATIPPPVLANPLTVTANPGDLFLFNSEFFHDTPRIVGAGSRTVFNSFAGFSSGGGVVEVYA